MFLPHDRHGYAARPHYDDVLNITFHISVLCCFKSITFLCNILMWAYRKAGVLEFILHIGPRRIPVSAGTGRWSSGVSWHVEQLVGGGHCDRVVSVVLSTCSRGNNLTIYTHYDQHMIISWSCTKLTLSCSKTRIEKYTFRKFNISSGLLCRLL